MPQYPLLEFVLTIGTWDTGGEAYPDTGFEGGLTIPWGFAREILAQPQVTTVRLADGSTRDLQLWPGEIELEGHRFRCDVVALGNRFLLGREVLDRLAISFEFGRRIGLRFSEE